MVATSKRLDLMHVFSRLSQMALPLMERTALKAWSMLPVAMKNWKLSMDWMAAASRASCPTKSGAVPR
jgi:hypothetical protein